MLLTYKPYLNCKWHSVLAFWRLFFTAAFIVHTEYIAEAVVLKSLRMQTMRLSLSQSLLTYRC